jgi:hypothetical protein
MKNTKSNVIWLKLSAFLLSIAPILLIVAFNWNDYTITVVETIKLSIGGIIAIMFLFLKCIGRLRMPERRVFTYFVVFVMVFLLESILNDLLLFSAGALLGELLALPVEYKAKKMEQEITIDKTADATAKKIENIVKNTTSNGRV